jgi:hypothetical protein
MPREKSARLWSAVVLYRFGSPRQTATLGAAVAAFHDLGAGTQAFTWPSQARQRFSLSTRQRVDYVCCMNAAGAWAGVFGVLAGCSALGQQVPSARPVPVAQAARMVGSNLVVIGTVTRVHKTEKAVRLSFETAEPREVFVGLLLSRSFNIFTNLDSLPGKVVTLSGKVVEVDGQPSMLLETGEQLKVLGRRPLPPTRLRIQPGR